MTQVPIRNMVPAGSGAGITGMGVIVDSKKSLSRLVQTGCRREKLSQPVLRQVVKPALPLLMPAEKENPWLDGWKTGLQS